MQEQEGEQEQHCVSPTVPGRQIKLLETVYINCLLSCRLLALVLHYPHPASHLCRSTLACSQQPPTDTPTCLAFSAATSCLFSCSRASSSR